jgi:hypothetical protein
MISPYLEPSVRKVLEHRLAGRGESPLTEQQWNRIKESAYAIAEADVILAADECYTALRELRVPTGSERPREPLYTEAELRRAEQESREAALRRQIVSIVEGIRKKHWGRTAVPFQNRRLVYEWVASRLHEGDRSESDDLFKPWLAFVGADNSFTGQNVKPESELGELQRSITTTAEWLHCEDALVADYIFMGKVPIVMPITAWVTRLAPIRITINYPWVRPASVRKFYAWARELQKALNPAGGASERVQALLDFGKKRPGANHRQRFEQWNRLHPDWRYGSIDSFRTAYNEAKRRWQGGNK